MQTRSTNNKRNPFSTSRTPCPGPTASVHHWPEYFAAQLTDGTFLVNRRWTLRTWATAEAAKAGAPAGARVMRSTRAGFVVVE